MLLACMGMLIFGITAQADSTYDNQKVDVDVESVEYDKVSSEVYKYIEKNEDGAMYFNETAAIQNGSTEEVIEIGKYINEITQSVKKDGYGVTMERSKKKLNLYKKFSYGNYCGPGNKGFKKKPIDDLDAACRDHDKCYKHFRLNIKCNAKFCIKLAKIIKKVNPKSKK